MEVNLPEELVARTQDVLSTDEIHAIAAAAVEEELRARAHYKALAPLMPPAPEPAPPIHETRVGPGVPVPLFQNDPETVHVDAPPL